MDDSKREQYAQTLLESSIIKIRASGGRITPSRLAILKSIINATEHMTAENIYAFVSRDNPDLHLSTVYRTLESLEAIGVIEHVHLGHGSATYHLSDNLHQHVVCENCGVTLEAPLDLTEYLHRELLERLDFHPKPQHFSIVGLCKECYAVKHPLQGW